MCKHIKIKSSNSETTMENPEVVLNNMIKPILVSPCSFIIYTFLWGPGYKNTWLRF